MHFSANDASVKMTMDLVGVQLTTSVLFWEFLIIWERLLRPTLRIDEITASVVLTPRVSETVTLSRPYAADKFSSCTHSDSGGEIS